MNNEKGTGSSLSGPADRYGTLFSRGFAHQALHDLNGSGVGAGEAALTDDGKAVVSADQSADVGLRDDVVHHFQAFDSQDRADVYHGVAAGGVKAGDLVTSHSSQNAGDDQAEADVDEVCAGSAGVGPLRVFLIEVQERAVEGGLKEKEAAAPADEPTEDVPTGKEAPKKSAPTLEKINSVLADTQFCNLKSEAKAYCDRELTKRDIDSLIYIYDNLKLSFDLIEYLLEYCASIKKTNFSYIEKVAINWYNNEITTRSEAEAFTAMYYSLYTKILKELGITSRMPAPVERKFIDHWTRDLGFTEPIILEACRRAISSKPNSVTFNYVNGILESWYNSNDNWKCLVQAECDI